LVVLVRKRPNDLVIVSRWIDAAPLQGIKENRIWHNDGAVVTHFMNAFQSLFPEGERLFIDSVRDCIKRHPSMLKQDPVLKDDVDHFIEQEGRHSVVHDKWNGELVAVGYTAMDTFDKFLHRFRVWAHTHLDMMTRLSFTIASEQYTASIAGLFTCDFPEILLGCPPFIQKILLYHAMEELEHKSVCFSLYQKFHGGYFRRIAGMIFITFDIWSNVFLRHRYLLRKDGLWDRKHKRECWRFYLGHDGLLQAVIPKIFVYLKPSFYPWQTDERRMFEDKFGSLLLQYGLPGFQYTETIKDGIAKTKEVVCTNTT
jgi:predicted metal-dependent hydrolase